jgi:hypothetical protein
MSQDLQPVPLTGLFEALARKAQVAHHQMQQATSAIAGAQARLTSAALQCLSAKDAGDAAAAFEYWLGAQTYLEISSSALRAADAACVEALEARDSMDDLFREMDAADRPVNLWAVTCSTANVCRKSKAEAESHWRLVKAAIQALPKPGPISPDRLRLLGELRWPLLRVLGPSRIWQVEPEK